MPSLLVQYSGPKETLVGGTAVGSLTPAIATAPEVAGGVVEVIRKRFCEIGRQIKSDDIKPLSAILRMLIETAEPILAHLGIYKPTHCYELNIAIA